jgi:hypothetical protein
MTIEAWEMVAVGIGGASFLVRGIAYAIEDWKGKSEKTVRKLDRKSKPAEASGVMRSCDRHAVRSLRRDSDRVA